MRGYIAVTGLVFGAIVVAHVLRAMEEGMHVVGNPWWVLGTIVAALGCAWSCRLLWRGRRVGP